MQKIIYMCVIFILTACTDNFLDRYPITTLNESNFYQTEQEYILLANGCYVPMRNFYKGGMWAITELRSDNTSIQQKADEGYFRNTGVIDCFLVVAGTSPFGDFWAAAYDGIYRCNKLLEEIDRPGVKWSKDSYKERCIGEALFLRALNYFDLVRQFGGIPLVLKTLTPNEAVETKRATTDQVYESIISDLTEAILHFSNAADVEENGRANLGASQTLLGKVYLTLHEYNKAETILHEVIKSGKYSLLSNYKDLFNPSKKDYKETIFAMQYSEASSATANNFIFRFAPTASKGAVTQRPSVNITMNGGFNQPTQDLIEAFEKDDLRKNASIGFWTGKDWDGVIKTIPYCSKYKPPISAPNDRCSDNFPILRYADVLLMYAETLNNQDRTDEAIPYVMQVRSRAGLNTQLTGFNKTSLNDLIAHERQIEFCFENQRWYDLVRTGKAIEVITAHGVREKILRPWLPANSFEINQDKLLAPIPLLQITVNKLEQNPGY
ncbi:MAG: RagB/SusD family nutrient uptake outer membrane protein [Proteiniphilum sp.]